jgi:hypothetical protein
VLICNGNAVESDKLYAASITTASGTSRNRDLAPAHDSSTSSSLKEYSELTHAKACEDFESSFAPALEDGRSHEHDPFWRVFFSVSTTVE